MRLRPFVMFTLWLQFLSTGKWASAMPVAAMVDQQQMVFLANTSKAGSVFCMSESTRTLEPRGQAADTIKKDTANFVRPAAGRKRYPLPLKSRNFRNGQQLKFFQAKDIRDEVFNLKAARGNIVVINFWFIACTPCRREMPELNALVAQYQNNPKVQFISIALDQKKELEVFLAASPFSYRVIDNGRALANGYGILSYPTHVVADSEGRVAYHSVGYAPESALWLRRTIDRLLQKEVLHP